MQYHIFYHILKFEYIKSRDKLNLINKGNNKITELRAILQRESQNSQVYKQTKSVNNRKTENRNDPDLVQAFLKKWWVESDFKAPNPPPPFITAQSFRLSL